MTRRPSPSTHLRSRRGHDDRSDEQGPQEEQEQVSQAQPPGGTPLGVGEIANGREVEDGGRAALSEMQERRDRRRGEPEEGQRMKEDHASRRSATPKGWS